MNPESVSLLKKILDITNSGKPLSGPDEDQVKSVLRQILESGDTYTMDELALLLNPEGMSQDESVVDRIMNMAHYQKSKFDAGNKFKVISDDCGCGGACSTF